MPLILNPQHPKSEWLVKPVAVLYPQQTSNGMNACAHPNHAGSGPVGSGPAPHRSVCSPKPPDAGGGVHAAGAAVSASAVSQADEAASAGVAVQGQDVTGGAAAPGQKRNAKAQARTVIGANGKPRRFVLTQPPGFRTGSDAPAPKDRAAAGAAIALSNARNRPGHQFQKQWRPAACWWRQVRQTTWLKF